MIKYYEENYPSFNKVIYDCAVSCATLRRTKKCRNQFDSSICSSCKWYIKKYINVEPIQAQLFMQQAEFHADIQTHSSKIHRTAHWLVFGFIAAVVLSIIGLNWYSGKQADKNFKWLLSEKMTDDQKIRETLKKVAIGLDEHTDVNGDELVNCIDAALLFYDMYPLRDNVTITVNKNNVTGMNHLFNTVLIDGMWRAIEPQAARTNQKSYWMKDIWGNRYDRSKNINVTSDYLKYLKKK